MTLLYYDAKFLQHETGAHPERPARVAQAWSHLQRTGLDSRCTRPSWAAISPERLARVHSPEYAQELAQYTAAGGGRIEVDTVVSRASFDVASLAAGAACDAVERVVRGEDRTAFCLVRPPGHHALGTAPMGFCLFNSIATAARTAISELDLDRVLIVDWDVHHGNGTQDVFWSDGQVAFFSIHRWPFYPGTGAADETGYGPGLGTTVNVPVRFEISREDYVSQYKTALESLADKFRPQLMLISAGFDSHHADPVGGLGLEIEDFEGLTQTVLDIAKVHASGRVVSVLEGGYNASILAGCVELHLKALLVADSQARDA